MKIIRICDYNLWQKPSFVNDNNDDDGDDLVDGVVDVVVVDGNVGDDVADDVVDVVVVDGDDVADEWLLCQKVQPICHQLDEGSVSQQNLFLQKNLEQNFMNLDHKQ